MNFELIKKGRYLALILTVGLYFPLVGQAIKKDTTFLFKDTVDGELQTIFIDPNPNSGAYEEISNFSFDYFDQLKAAKKDQPVTKSVLPWTNWVTLKQYKGNFYVYRPCDFLYHFRQSFYDSTIVNWY